MTRAAVERLYREESRRILATLIRLLRDFDRAEESMHVAFEAALDQWPREGVPENPRAWIVRAARNKAIDAQRHARMAETKLRLSAYAEDEAVAPEELDAVPDDMLRLVFTCCHPALALDAQVALTLRTLGGLTTDEIARAFLVPSATMAQRLVRAKRKITDAGIPYHVPTENELTERLDGVLAVLYLIFTESYAATSGPELVRVDLAVEAIRLARLLVTILPDRAEPKGLCALLLLHDARRATRTDSNGAIVLLEDQDRALWDTVQIEEGLALVEASLTRGHLSAYSIQAAIAALHARAKTAAETDWPQIAALYGVLCRIAPSPVIELNHAVAVAMVDGPERGLRLLDALHGRGPLSDFHLMHAARADLLRRLGRRDEAVQAYREALAYVGNEAERRFLVARLATLSKGL